MKKDILITISAIFVMAFCMSPSFALSSLAEAFIRDVSQPDAVIPPPNWSREDLRSAALEVLDTIENGAYEKTALDYSLKTLGFLQYAEDLPRILAYEEKMPYTVLRSIAGFPHPDAINCLIGHLDDEKSPRRKLAVKGLAAMDFTKLDKPEIWKNKVKDAIQKALSKEKVDWLKKDIKIALAKVEKAKTK